MLLITGPSGNVGHELVALLAAQPGARFWIAGREPTQPGSGTVEAYRMDFFDRSTWGSTLADVDRLFLLFPLPGNRAAREAIVPFVAAAEQATRNKVKFLPRRNIECYCLDEEVIADVLAPLLRKNHAECATSVVDWMKLHGGDSEFGASRVWQIDTKSSDWRKHVDGAKLLARLFAELSNNKDEFRKTSHTPFLVLASMERSTADSKELTEFANSLFKRLLAE